MVAHKEPLTTEQKELILIRQALDTYLAGLATSAEITSLLATLATYAGRVAFSMDFWSIAQEEAQVPAVAANVSLPSVTLSDLPTGFTVVRIQAMFKARMIENVAASANKLSGTQYIQCSPNTWAWTNAIDFADDLFGIAASTREPGDVMIGSRDLSPLVAANGTIYFRWASALADAASLNFNDVQTGLRVWFR